STDHPPLSYLLVKLTVDVFHTDTGWALRLPSLVCGVLCIPAAYLLGRVIWKESPLAGLLVALLACVDLNLVWQSQQARMYSMLMLVSLVGTAFMLLILNHKRQAAISVLLGVILGVAVWLHYSSLALWGGAIAAIV